MIGKLKNSITVQQLFEYATKHNLLKADAKIVLDIINGDTSIPLDNNSNKSVNNINTINLDKVEYTTDDLLILFSM